LASAASNPFPDADAAVLTGWNILPVIESRKLTTPAPGAHVTVKENQSPNKDSTGAAATGGSYLSSGFAAATASSSRD
jgi:hypothetical protein